MSEAKSAYAALTESPFLNRPATRFLRWRDEWCFGIHVLDNDHRAMAELLDRIAVGFGEEAVAERGAESPAELQHWLHVLGDQARMHFAREEALMRTVDYPELFEHRREHAMLLAEYTAMVRDIVARQTDRLDQQDLEALKHWFLGHLLYMDKRLARYLDEAGIQSVH